MTSVSVYNLQGKETEKMELPSEIFGLEPNKTLIAQAVTAQLANSRQHLAHTKDRGEVRGGGKKPWRQKGTGRSRHGSIRSPLWAGGGVTFGPRKQKNYTVKINRQMKRKALLMVLSGKLADNEIVVLDEVKISQPKTKEMAKIFDNLKNIKKDLSRGALMLMPEKSEDLLRASRNIKGLGTMSASSLNLVDLLSFKYLIMPKKAVEKIAQNYGNIR